MPGMESGVFVSAERTFQLHKATSSSRQLEEMEPLNKMSELLNTVRVGGSEICTEGAGRLDRVMDKVALLEMPRKFVASTLIMYVDPGCKNSVGAERTDVE
jgi:hypothetical protein